MVLGAIIKQAYCATSDSIRKLERELEALNFNAEPGENVETFCNKFRVIGEKLEQGVDRKPTDLNVLMAKKLLNKSVESFRIGTNSVYNQVSLNVVSMTWQGALFYHVSSYKRLVGSVKWTLMNTKEKTQAKDQLMIAKII